MEIYGRAKSYMQSFSSKARTQSTQAVQSNIAQVQLVRDEFECAVDEAQKQSCEKQSCKKQLQLIG